MVVRMVYESKVTSKYQITIPEPIRKAYAVRSGSKLVFIPKKDGFEIKAPKKVDNIAEKLFGMAKFKGDAVEKVNKVRSEMR